MDGDTHCRLFFPIADTSQLQGRLGRRYPKNESPSTDQSRLPRALHVFLAGDSELHRHLYFSSASFDQIVSCCATPKSEDSAFPTPPWPDQSGCATLGYFFPIKVSAKRLCKMMISLAVVAIMTNARREPRSSGRLNIESNLASPWQSMAITCHAQQSCLLDNIYRTKPSPLYLLHQTHRQLN